MSFTHTRLEMLLKDTKTLSHNMLARYEMGIGDPTHRMKLLDKLRRIRMNLEEIDEIVSGELFMGGYPAGRPGPSDTE